MVTIDRERLISEKQNNKASPVSARLPKKAVLLRDIFKFAKSNTKSLHRLSKVLLKVCQETICVADKRSRNTEICD